MMPCEHGYYGLCPQCVREERDELRSRVAKLERERDQLALSLSATRAERDHAVRSAELWESEHRAGYEAMGVYKHLWLEGRAIMAVCGYFSRMREPCCYKVFTDHEDYEYIDDGVPVGYPSANIIPLYAGSAPVPAAPQSASKVAYDAVQDALETLRGIAGATARAWELPSNEFIDEFLPWAQSRARDTAAKIAARVPTQPATAPKPTPATHELASNIRRNLRHLHSAIAENQHQSVLFDFVNHMDSLALQIEVEPNAIVLSSPQPSAVPEAVAKARCNKCGGADYAPHELYCADHPDNTILSAAGNEVKE